jgi:hypothetical protein
LITAEETIRNPNVILETELVVRASCGANVSSAQALPVP